MDISAPAEESRRVGSGSPTVTECSPVEESRRLAEAGMSHSRPEEGLDREVVVVSPVKMADQAEPQEQEQILVLGQGHPGHPEQDPGHRLGPWPGLDRLSGKGRSGAAGRSPWLGIGRK